MKDALGHGSDAKDGEGAAHQQGVAQALSHVRPVTPEALNAFVGRVQALRADHFERTTPEDVKDRVRATNLGQVRADNPDAPKYIRIVTDQAGQGKSAYAFVNRTTGDIHKPAGYKSPVTKNTRGNIHDEHGGMSMLGPYGTRHLR